MYQFLYSIVCLSLFAAPTIVSCMELASSKPTKPLSALNKTYTLESEHGKQFPVDKAFIENCGMFSLFRQDNELPNTIPLSFSDKKLSTVISLFRKTEADLTHELSQTPLEKLLKLAPTLELLQPHHILPIFYKVLETKLYEPTLKNRLCNDAAYAQHLFTNGLHEELRIKVNNSHQIKNNLSELVCCATYVSNAENTQINDLQISRDGNYLFSAFSNGDIKIWHIADPRNITLVATIANQAGTVNTLQISNDGRYLFTNDISAIKVWDVTNLPTITHVITWDAHAHSITKLKVSNNGQYLFSASIDGELTIWNITHLPHITPITTILNTWPGDALQISNNNQYLFSSSSNGEIRIWNIADPTRAVCVKTLRAHTWGLDILQISTNNHYLFSASHDNTIKIWDITSLNNPTLVTVLSDTIEATALQVSKDGKYLFAAYSNNTVKIWNITNPKKPTLVVTLPDHMSMVHDLQANTNSIDPLTGSHGASYTLNFEWHSQKIQALQIHDRYLFSSYGNTIKVWDLDFLNCSDYYPTNNLLLEHAYVIYFALQARRTGIKLDLTTKEKAHVLDWYQSMPEQFKKIVKPYCILDKMH